MGAGALGGAGRGKEGRTVHSKFRQRMQEVRGISNNGCPMRQGTRPDPWAPFPHGLIHATLFFGVL